jgi:hypothetical protein
MAKAKRSFKVTSEWSTILKQGEHLVREESGEVYRIEPVDLDTFVTSKDYLGQDLWGLSEPQKDFINNVSDFENGKNFFVLYVGKGAGKNFSSGVAFLYVVYKLLCMYDPHKYLNHNKSKNITLINVAINAIQAKKNFFDPMVNMLRQAGDKAFNEFGFNFEKDVLSSSIQFPGNIEIMSANSRAGGIEGYDLLMALADEVDDVEFHSVDKILNTLRTSAQSRFIGKEKVIVISYRRYVGSSGKILEFYNSARGLAHVYARRYASWEFHPARPKEFFQQYYDENPEKAACMYGSDLSGSYVDSWVRDPKRIKKAMRIDRQWIFDWPLPYQTSEPGSEEWKNRDIHDEWKQSPLSEHTYRDKNGIQKILDPYDIPIKEYGNPKHYYVMCGDPALGSELNGGDGYGLTMGHREIVTDELGRKFVRPVIDFSFRFTGRMFPEGQVQMKAIEDLIVKLKNRYGYNIKLFSWDGWNSMSLTQWLAKTYKDAIIYDRSVVDTKDYSALRDAIFGEAPPTSGHGGKESNGGIDMPWHPILYDELMNLRVDNSKNPPKIDHINSSTKDMSDTLARVVRLIVYEWPFMDVVATGTNYSESEDIKKVKAGIASNEEQERFNEKVYSDSIGMGKWKQTQKGGNAIKLSDLLPDLGSGKI